MRFVLNRTIRLIAKGLGYEPDQRHSEIIIKAMGIEGAKSSASPGAAETPEWTRLMTESPDRQVEFHRGG